jgi:hypothetical protein
MKNPCIKNCPHRKAECVKTCKRYQEFEAERTKERLEQKPKTSEIDSYLGTKYGRSDYGERRYKK